MQKILVLLAALLVASTAQAAEYRILADRKADFDNFKTFRFDKVTITRSSGATVKSRNTDSLRAAVAEQLLKEGLTETKGGSDLIVSVIAGIDARLQAVETQGMPYFDGAWRILPKESPAPQLMEYNQATLRVDLKNAASGEVVWRALVSDMVRLPVSQERVAAALAKAFQQYPPPAP